MRSKVELRNMTRDIVEDVVNGIGKQEVREAAEAFGFNITPEEQSAILNLLGTVSLTVEFDEE